MGMRAHYVELDSEDMTQILDEPDAACEILMGGGMGGMDIKSAMQQMGIASADLKKLESVIGPMPSFLTGGSKAAKPKNRPSLEIEKSWQAIHFVLNGDPWKGHGLLGNVVLGGKEVGEDMGYGAPRYLDAFKVIQTSAELDRITDDDFRNKAKSANFAGKGIYVYGDHLSGDDLEELIEFFSEVRAFFRAAADKGNGILLGIV